MRALITRIRFATIGAGCARPRSCGFLCRMTAYATRPPSPKSWGRLRARQDGDPQDGLPRSRSSWPSLTTYRILFVSSTGFGAVGGRAGARSGSGWLAWCAGTGVTVLKSRVLRGDAGATLDQCRPRVVSRAHCCSGLTRPESVAAVVDEALVDGVGDVPLQGFCLPRGLGSPRRTDLMRR